jgi:hypothetical protein
MALESSRRKLDSPPAQILPLNTPKFPAELGKTLYYSGHGQASGRLDVGVEPEDVLWNKEMKIAILAGCSVLDINDYNQNGKYSVMDGALTPGERWNQTGPQFLLGYNHTAPSDEQNSDLIASNWATNRSSEGIAMAWMNANDNSNGCNACAIEKNTMYYYFHPTSILGISWYTLKQIPVSEW